jgi:pimeloyl-ACP methyl ester carboxylesterase
VLTRDSLNKSTIDIPTLFVLALKDAALPPWMSTNMGQSIPNLTKKEVDASHWALWERPAEVNAYVKEWLQANGATSSKSTL